MSGDEKPQPQPPMKVGDMTATSAGALEVMRGLGSTGAGVVALYLLLQSKFEALASQVEHGQAEVGHRIMRVEEGLERLRDEVHAIKVEAARRDGELKARP